jgi:hypothetical protein
MVIVVSLHLFSKPNYKTGRGFIKDDKIGNKTPVPYKNYDTYT